MTTLNTPLWTPARPAHRGGFQEVWYLKLNDPAANRALWLRMTLLLSDNGFRRVAETWAIFFQRSATRELTKVAVKQTHDISAFSTTPEGAIRIADCEFEGQRIHGRIQSKGQSISWDLAIRPQQDLSFNLVPESLRRLGLVKNGALTVGEDLLFSGTSEINGQKMEWRNAPGMQGHLSGPKVGHSWAWGHCNLFVDDRGQPAHLIFEGLSARARLIGPIPSPRLSTLFFFYDGKAYRFNSFWDSLRVKSHYTLTEWTFQADRGDLSFRGKAKAELKDFAGVNYEDTNGSFLFCANSKLSNLEIHVYRRGKLERTFYSAGMAAFEVVTRQKNPYVPVLI
ncbi:hypothetical protein WDW37_13500 [Bdellovibrionota bacterium FG-1]